MTFETKRDNKSKVYKMCIINKGWPSILDVFSELE